LASSKGLFSAWWTAASYNIFKTLGFDMARADSIHSTTLNKISAQFKQRHAALAAAGRVKGKWGEDGSFQLSNFDRNPDLPPTLSKYVADEDLLSVCSNNWATDWAVGTFFLMICAASRSVSVGATAMVCLLPSFVPLLLAANTTAASLADKRHAALLNITGVTNEYIRVNGATQIPLWVPVMLPGHFILLIHLPAEQVLLVCDPLGKAAGETRRAQVNAFVNWLTNSLGRVRPAVKYLSLPKQTDSTSCGPFCMAYILYALLHNGRPPPADDWSGANANVIRSIVADILLSGKVPLPGGGVYDCAGAGLPAVPV
jgi:hypothetical protein